MKVMIWPSEPRMSSSTALSRSSNSPRNLDPATMAPRSRATIRLSLSDGGHVAVHDPPGQPLDDGGLADAGLADQHRVVLGPARQHLDDPADLVVAADHRVEPALAGHLGQVAAEALQGLVLGLRVLVGDLLAPADLGRGRPGWPRGSPRRRSAAGPRPWSPRSGRAAGARWRRTGRRGRRPPCGPARAGGPAGARPPSPARGRRPWGSGRGPPAARVLSMPGSAPARRTTGYTTPSGSASRDSSRCSGSIRWWSLERASRWALASASAARWVKLFTSIDGSVSRLARTVMGARSARSPRSRGPGRAGPTGERSPAPGGGGGPGPAARPRARPRWPGGARPPG